MPSLRVGPLLLLASVCCLGLPWRQTSACRVTLETQPFPSSYTRGNRLTLLQHRKVTLHPSPGSAECHVDGEVLSLSNVLDSVLVHYEFVALTSLPEVKVHFTTNSSSTNTSITSMAEVTFVKCVPSVDSFRDIASRSTTMVVTFDTAALPEAESPGEKEDLCEIWRSVSELTIRNSNSVDLEPLLNCSEEAPLLAMSTITIENAGLSELSQRFRSAFPNLQSLGLQRNKLRIPPSINMSASRIVLPGNLQRSGPVDDEYTGGGIIPISTREIRKALLLDSNNITSLERYVFHGCFDFISLGGNGLRGLNVRTFSSVSCLRWLNLGDNALTELPEGLFAGLSGLKRLVVSNNYLTDLRDTILQNLGGLVELDMSNNDISVLSSAFVRPLRSLKTLIMDGNKFVTVPRNIFKLNYIQLIHFNNNPLQTLPDGVFHPEDLSEFSARNTSITSLNFTERCRLDWPDLNMRVISSTTMQAKDLPMRPVDLRGAEPIQTTFQVQSKLCRLIMEVVFCSFKFLLDSLHCDCGVLSTAQFMKNMLANNTCTNVRQNAWSCASPEELRGRSILSLQPQETYCPVVLEACPTSCRCFQRAGGARRVIVDCRGRGLTSLPERLPGDVEVELWLEDNAVSRLAWRPYLPRLHTLRLSRNALTELEADVLEELGGLRELSVDANLLAALPPQLARFSQQLSSLRLSANPFRCDCHARWLQTWVASSPGALQDGSAITCNLASEGGSGVLLQRVPGEQLVCVEDAVRARVVVQAGVSSVVVVLVAVGVGGALLFRRRLKLWLYVHTSWHPFDRDPPRQQAEGQDDWDVAVVCGCEQDTWVWSQVSQRLEEERGLHVLHCWRDFRLGLTHGQNLARAAARCRRLLLVLTPESLGDSLVGAAVRMGVEAARQRKDNFLVLLLHGCRTLQTTDEGLKDLLKSGRFITTKDRHFFKKIMYFMPQDIKLRKTNDHAGPREDKKGIQAMNGLKIDVEQARGKNGVINPGQDIHIELEEGQQAPVPADNEQENPQRGLDMAMVPMTPAADDADPETLPIFVWYHGQDLAFVLEQLVEPLRVLGVTWILEDKDFLPGESKEENLVRAVEASRATLVVLSACSLQDEWGLHAFQVALSRQMAGRRHVVALCRRRDCPEEGLDKEMQQFLQSSTSLCEGGPWFRERLIHLAQVHDAAEGQHDEQYKV